VAAAGDNDDGNDDQPDAVVVKEIAEAVVHNRSSLKGSPEWVFPTHGGGLKSFALLLPIYACAPKGCAFFVGCPQKNAAKGEGSEILSRGWDFAEKIQFPIDKSHVPVL
jgi:hypothetical protein